MKKATEIIHLETEKKWEYLKRFYKDAAEFYNACDTIVGDDEIDRCIAGFKRLPKPEVRKEIDLADWKFMPDNEDAGVGEGYFLHEFDESGWAGVKVPHAFGDAPQNPVTYGRAGYSIYTGKDKPAVDILRGDAHAWYKTRIPFDGVKENEVAYLHFASVNLNSDVWVNDYPVVTGHLGLFPFNAEVTETLQSAFPNSPVIALRVSNTASNIPHMFYNGFQFAYYDRGGRLDWISHVWGGLADDVTLKVMNKRHISDLLVHTQSISPGKARVRFDIALRNQSKQRFSGKIGIGVSKWFPVESRVLVENEANVEILPLNDSKASVFIDIAAPDLWAPEAPNLYLARLTLFDCDGAPVDDLFESFGIRIFEMKGPHFYLNGKKTVLRGTHDVCHYYGEPVIRPGDRSIVKDILLHKKMGANCSRWPSDIRLHCKQIARYCDQLGYMLSWAGFFEVWTQHSEIETLLPRDVRETVRSLKNHPSVVIWEMGDEALMSVCDYRRMRFNERMLELVCREDHTRPIVPNGFYCNDLVDFIKGRPGDADYACKRRRVLEEYPLFTHEKAVWDIHKCPYFPPFAPEFDYIDSVRQALGGQRPTVYTEFGADALPDPANVADVYGGFRWQANAFISVDRDVLDMGQYGKPVRQEDWRETQAFQAIAVSGIINRLRQYPDEFAAYYFVTMFDVWIFYWGAADVKGNCKLSYFVLKNHLSPLFVSALHGSVAASLADGLDITASNYGDDIHGATLKVILRDAEGKAALEKETTGINVKGDVALTNIAHLDISSLPAGLYGIEYYVASRDGGLLGKMFEMAYFE